MIRALRRSPALSTLSLCAALLLASAASAVAASEFEIELADGTTYEEAFLVALEGDSVAVSLAGRQTITIHIADIAELREDGTNWWWAGAIGAGVLTGVLLAPDDYEASNSGAGIMIVFGAIVAAGIIGAIVVGKLTGDTTYDLREMNLEQRRKQIFDLVFKSK